MFLAEREGGIIYYTKVEVKLLWQISYPPANGASLGSYLGPIFSICMQSDVTLLLFCLMTFRKKTQLYTTVNYDLMSTGLLIIF